MIGQRRSSVVGAAAICLFVLAPSESFALDATKSISQYVHDSWQSEDGLPQNSVMAITQTRDGYLWFGTQEGVVRFDGVRFTTFRRDTTKELESNYILALHETPDRTLWIGTERGGLVALRDGVFRRYAEGHGLPADTIYSIATGRGGRLVAASGDGAMSHFDGRRFTVERRVPAPKTPSFCRILRGRGGELWLGTRGGLHRIDDRGVTTYRKRDGLSDDTIVALFEDRRGQLWIGTRWGGLNRFSDGQFTHFGRQEGLPNDTVWSIHEDRDGSLWVGTGAGLTRFQDGRFEPAVQPGLATDMISSIYEDVEGSLWVGTMSSGLHRLKDGKFVVYDAAAGLADDSVAVVLQDAAGAVWIGTRNGGLTRLIGRTPKTYRESDGLLSDDVTALAEAAGGGLWVGTSKGLQLLRDGSIGPPVGGLAVDRVNAIATDRSGALWVAMNRTGVARIHGGTVTPYTRANGLADNEVRSLICARNGAVWIGTENGLNRFHQGRLETFTTREGLSNDFIWSITEDDAGDLWLGTNRGLNRLRGGVFTHYTTADGLFDDLIYQVVDDGAGSLWMTCNRGISRIRKDDLDAIDRGASEPLVAVAYGQSDGLRSSECNGGSHPAGSRSHDGKLWFPTIRGAAMIDPRRLNENRRPPPMVVETLVADRVPFRTPSAKVPPGARNLEIHYTALSLVAPEKVRFRYKLEGFDSQWIDAGSRRVAWYTNVPPGSYRFRAIASNNDGIWNNAGAAFPFVLEPYFYETWQFYAFLIMAALLTAWTAYRMRVGWVEAKAAVFEERNRIAGEIHDSLAQGLGGVIVQLDATLARLGRSPEQVESHVRTARESARQSLEEARRSVWALRSPLLDGSELPEALMTIARRIAAGTDSEIDVEVHGDPVPLDGELEMHLLRVGQEAVSNAVRHARANRITIELSYGPTEVALTVRDDGRGFDAAIDSGRGFGFDSMRARSRKLGGQMTVVSRPGEGTVISFSCRRSGGVLQRLMRKFRHRRVMHG